MAYLEETFNATLHAVQPKRADSEEEDKLNAHLTLRVLEPDVILQLVDAIAGADLAPHLGQTGMSLNDWLESNLSVIGSMNFLPKFEDHELRLRAGGRNIAYLGDCKVGGFSVKQNTGNIALTVKIQANAVNGKDQFGPLADFVDRNVQCAIKRAKHWQEQTEIPGVDGEAESAAKEKLKKAESAPE